MARGGFALAVILIAGSAEASSLSLDKGPVVLGRTESVGVTVRIDEAPGSEDRPLRLAVNVGSFSPVTRASPGVYRTVYLPPVTRFPQVALVAVWKETDAEAPIDFLRIPLYGSTQIPVTAEAKAEVRMTVGIEDYGPVIADGHGKAVVPAAVPPGVNEAVIHVSGAGMGQVSRKIPIQVPPYNRLTVGVVPHALLADGKAWARVEVFYDLGGVQVSAERVKVKASLGQLTLLRADRGRYVYRYQPPPDATAKEAKFSVAVDGDPVAMANASVELGLPPPARAILRTPDAAIPADGRASAPVSVLILDAQGLGLPGEKVTIAANGKPISGVVDKGDGSYVATFIAPDTYPAGGLVQFAAQIARQGGSALSAAANYQLKPTAVPGAVTVHVTPDPIPADGRTQANVVLDVRDSAGLPLHHAQLFLVASHGTLGALAEQGDGTYRAAYVAPELLPIGDTVLKVVDSAGGFEKSLALPLRDNPHRLLVGARVGGSHNFGDLTAPRAGLELWAPVRIRSTYFGAGASVDYGWATQVVSDGTFFSRSNVSFVPIALKVGVEAYAARSFSLTAGLGGVATFARFTTSLSGERASAWGPGGLVFLAADYAVGPGQAFAELELSVDTVSKGDFQLDAGGLGLELGYRFGVL